ncbi:MAG: UPF0182 family protein, partial [Chloroflexota bacterium]
MRSEDIDIPEVFRRAFEEERDNGPQRDGGENGRGRGNGGGRGRPRRFNPRVWLILLPLLLLLSGRWLATIYTEWLWFVSLGYQNVWLKQWGTQAVAFVGPFLVALVVLLLNWRLAAAISARLRPGLRQGTSPLDGVFSPTAGRWLLTIVALFFALLLASTTAGRWQSILLYAYRVPFGAQDPVFQRDLSFYLFELPVYRFLQSWLTSLFVIALLGVLTIYGASNWQLPQRGQLFPRSFWRQQHVPAVRQHVALLAALCLGLWAAGYGLRIYQLLYSTRGVVFGASYTDLQAALPALRAQSIILALLALAVAYNYFRLDLRPPLAIGGLWLVATLLLGNLYPAFLQRYQVEPNELARELPYIQDNMTYTRLAFDLEQIEVRPFTLGAALEAEDLANNEVALQNVRVWDYRPLQQTYAQLQELRPYYHFSSIDIDRYSIGDTTRQVMLAARELNKANLPSRSWVNEKLVFTHGYGVVMNPVDRFTAEGRPEFFVSDLPPRTTVPIEIERPEVYFGELMDDVVFVASDLDEFDFPQGEENVYSSYQGQGGVRLGNWLNRLAFTLRFGEINLLLSEYVTPDTRVLLHRQIAERVQRITPFLTLDNDPYLVVADGRLVWMLDAYTVSRYFPYATPTESGLNYIRNAAKITIDAYDGVVTYYLADADDPLAQSYGQAFPGLFRPLSEMPAALQAHIRYPEDLFRVQTQQYLKYHMTDAQVFYNQEDLWQIPQEIRESEPQPIEPYYVIFRLPDEPETEFLLIQPYSPSGKNNMIAWIAARNDPAHYGQLVAYELPKQELVFGPIQVEGRIDQDPLISQQISLWDQRGSQVIRGNLIIIPIDGAFLYVEPLYILSDTNALPELKRIIVASGDRIAMRETLAEALQDLVSDRTAAPVTSPPADSSTGVDSSSTPADATLQQLIESAN